MSDLGMLVGRAGFNKEGFRVKGPAGGVVPQVFTATLPAGDNPGDIAYGHFPAPFDCQLVAASLTALDPGAATMDAKVYVASAAAAASVDLTGAMLSNLPDSANAVDSCNLTDADMAAVSIPIIAGENIWVDLAGTHADATKVFVHLTFITI